MDACGLELLRDRVPAGNRPIIRVVDGDLAAMLVEEVEDVGFAPVFDLSSEYMRLFTLPPCIKWFAFASPLSCVLQLRKNGVVESVPRRK